MTGINPFELCPVFTTENFFLRQTVPEDAGDLLLCYSDKEAVRFFNSDNCRTDFYFQTLEEMQKYMKVWEREYREKVYVRFSIIRKAGETAIGTIEFCPWRKSVEGYGKLAVLRIDLGSIYETEAVIMELLKAVEEYFYGLFQVERVITKAIPEAEERIKALLRCGYRKLKTGAVVPFDGYYIH